MSTQRPHVVAGLLRSDNKVLLCHRSPSSLWYPDVWDLPGGHVDAHEDPLEALVREMQEELDIRIAEPANDPVFEVNQPDLHMLVWLLDTWHGRPVNQAPEEHDLIEWFTLDEIEQLTLADPAFLPMFRRVVAT